MAVFSGMLGVTLFGIFLTPVFFYVIDSVSESHFFASPQVRRIGAIALAILIAQLLWRPVALVRAASPVAIGADGPPPSRRPCPNCPPRIESESESLELVEQE